MQKVIKFLLFCCFIVLFTILTEFFFSWFTQQSQLTNIVIPVQLSAEEQRWLSDHQPIRVAYDGNFPPYSFIDESGQFAGIAYDTIELIGKKLNIQFQTDHRQDWKIIYKATLAKEIDIIATMVNRPERVEQFYFSSPYIFKSLAIITHQSNNLIKTRDDLRGKKIALLKNYQYSQELLNALQKITPVYVNSIEDALLAVETQQVDATICFFASSSYLQNKHHFNHIKFTSFYERNNANESIAVRKDLPVLSGIMQKGLNAITTQEKQAIHKLWGSSISAPPPVSNYLVKVGIICLLILSSLVIWLGWVTRQNRSSILTQKNLLNANHELTNSITMLENQLGQYTEKLHDSEQKLHRLTSKLSTEFFFYQLDIKGKYTYLSVSMTDILGYSIEQFAEHHDTYLTDHPDNQKIDEYNRLSLQGLNPPSRQIEIFDAQHKKRSLKLIESPIIDTDGLCIGLDGIAQDITPLVQSNARLSNLTHFDDLTGLANKRLLIEQLEQTITSTQTKQSTFSLISLDIDGFKLINDHFGHATGDAAMQEIAHRLQSHLGNGEIAARIGGDEFALILLHADAKSATAAAKRILNNLLTPFEINQHQFALGASVGIAMYPQDGSDSETLIQNADSAMYIAKNKNIAYALFSPEPETSRKKRLEDSLQKLLAQDDISSNSELYLVYHSIHCIQEKNILAYEALIRWRHPELGIILPNELIPLAIETGLIAKLSHRVITLAGLQACHWTKNKFSFGKITINIAMIELVDYKLPETIIQLIKSTGAKPEWFEIEITESTSIQMPDVSSKVIKKLLDAGIQTSLDQFGTDSSSLATLKNLPVSGIKIAPSLMHDIHNSSANQATVHAIISLSHLLGKKVIAIGIENHEQLQFLVESHCDMIQGYYFSTPSTQEKITNYISQIYN